MTAILISIVTLFVSMGVGSYFKHHEKYEDTIDHPIEQMAENFLSSQGVDVDFSADKKKDKEDGDDSKKNTK